MPSTCRRLREVNGVLGSGLKRGTPSTGAMRLMKQLRGRGPSSWTGHSALSGRCRLQIETGRLRNSLLRPSRLARHWPPSPAPAARFSAARTARPGTRAEFCNSATRSTANRLVRNYRSTRWSRALHLGAMAISLRNRGRCSQIGGTQCPYPVTVELPADCVVWRRTALQKCLLNLSTMPAEFAPWDGVNSRLVQPMGSSSRGGRRGWAFPPARGARLEKFYRLNGAARARASPGTDDLQGVLLPAAASG